MKRSQVLSRQFSPRQVVRLIVFAAFALPGLVWGDATLTRIGVTPLNDLGTGVYKGYVGGLYPGGSNVRPSAHDSAGIAIAQSIHPLDASGNVDDTNGKIVMISVGMSNTTQEFASGSNSSFKPRMDADPSKSPRLVIVDGAQGGQTVDSWIAPSTPVWQTLTNRLTAAGVTGSQVQVAWIKQAIANPSNLGAFPTHAQVLKDRLAIMVRLLKQRLPNLKLAYLSSRTRAYTDIPGTLNPEPFAFESGYSVKWLIEDQINGVGDLNYDSGRGTVTAPWLAWGPYLWTDGLVPRSDGFVWAASDLGSDFVHPSTSGQQKVASQLITFFKTDATTRPWFLKQGAVGQPPQVAVSSVVTFDTVTFTATAYDPDGQIVQYVWNFGDGGFAYNTANPTKQYRGPGPYTATVTVTDNSGNAVTQEITVELQDASAAHAISRLGALILAVGIVRLGSPRGGAPGNRWLSPI